MMISNAMGSQKNSQNDVNALAGLDTALAFAGSFSDRPSFFG